MADDGSEKMDAEKVDTGTSDEATTENEPSEQEGSNITNEDDTEGSKLSDTNLSETKAESNSKLTSSISLEGEKDAGSKQEDEKEETEKDVAEEKDVSNTAEESRSMNKVEEYQSVEQRTKSTSTAVTPKDSEVSLTTSDSTAQTSESSLFSAFTVHETVITQSSGRCDSTEASPAVSFDDEEGRERLSRAEKYAQQAHALVNMVITSATKHLVQESMCRVDTMAEIEGELSHGQALGHMTPTHEEAVVENIEWLTIAEFTVDRGTAKIEEFIEKTWVYQDNWLFCTDHLGKEEFDYDTRYRYRIRWSVPTRRKPIPRATASVYFTFSVSKVKPRDYPVDVYYVFEINRLVHRPGESRFREKWLKDIIESKVITMKGIHF